MRRTEASLTIPALIMYVEHNCGKSGLSGAFGDSGIVKVTQLSIPFPLWVAGILAQNHIRHCWWGYTFKHLNLQRAYVGKEIRFFTR